MIKVKGEKPKALWTYPEDAEELKTLRAEVERLRKRNVTLEAMVTKSAVSNVTRQRAYRERKKANED
jgi:hypothetical protein